MRYTKASYTNFADALADARETFPAIEEATTDPAELPRHWEGGEYFLAEDGLSGYGLVNGEELVGVWSRVKGRGDELVQDATLNGAWRLDCFDGYLTVLYTRNGFVETDREENWDGPDGPDVVFFERHTTYPHFPGTAYDCVACEPRFTED